MVMGENLANGQCLEQPLVTSNFMLTGYSTSVDAVQIMLMDENLANGQFLKKPLVLSDFMLTGYSNSVNAAQTMLVGENLENLANGQILDQPLNCLILGDAFF